MSIYFLKEAKPPEPKENTVSRKMRAADQLPLFIEWRSGRKDFKFDDFHLARLLEVAEKFKLFDERILPTKASLDCAWDIARRLLKYKNETVSK
jgi:hypothetical protein